MNRIQSSGDNRGEKKAAEVVEYFRRILEPGSDCNAGFSYRLTAKGAWAASRPAHLFDFFNRIDLSASRLFIDLGSGDGVAACIAGIFTRSIGIESDELLISRAAKSIRDLKLEDRVSLIRADFLTQAVQAADCLYIYPDKPVYSLEQTLADWDGTLLIYGPHFPPKSFCLREKLVQGRETLSVYEK